MLHRYMRRWGALLTLTMSLVACGGSGGGTSTSPPLASLPIASISAAGAVTDANGAVRGTTNGLITLDASSSTVASGAIRSYAWVLSAKPSGSRAAMSNADQKAAAFTPDIAGNYQITLTLTSDAGQSVSKTVDFIVAGAPPVANIVVSASYTGSTPPAQPLPIDATLGSVFTLDSSLLKATDGTAVSTTWTIEQRPAGSLAKVQVSGTQFQMTPDLMGNYVLKARVQDIYGSYSDAYYTLRMVYAPPSTVTMIVAPSFSATAVEQAPIDTTLGTNFLLDTSGITASDGSPVTTNWKLLQRPTGSAAVLVGADPKMQFRPDQLGLYKLIAHVQDKRGAYSESIVSINVKYSPPTTTNILVNGSFTGSTVSQSPISASLGSVFTLDTSLVQVDDGSAVTSTWQILAKPAGSIAPLNGSGTRYQFTPDVLGTYQLKIRVQDIRGAWGESIYTLSVLNRPPVANANINTAPVAAISYGNARVQSGAAMSLRGGASFDADGDTLSYAWTLSNAPASSLAKLNTATSVDTSITFDADGDYTIRLRVTDPSGAYSDRQIVVKVGDAPPVVVYDHNTWTSVLGSSATASAAYSYSPQGKALTYQWTLDSRPNGSSASIPNNSAAVLSFTPDAPGNYIASVVVSDGVLKSTASFALRVLATSDKTTALNFKPRDIRYSKGLDQIVITSASPDMISFVDPFSGLVRSSPLLATANRLTLSPDGKLAAVLYGTILDLFDVATATRIRSTNILSTRSEALLMNSGEVFLFGGDQWSGVPGLLNARTGATLPLSVQYANGTYWGSQQYGLLADKKNKALTVSGGLSPSKITYLKFSATNTSSVLGSGDWPYHGTYNANYLVGLNTQQSLVFDASGLVANADDLTFAGRINLSGSLINVSSSSDDSELLALNGTGTYSSSYSQIDPVLFLVKNSLNFPAIDGGQSYGLALFHSASDRHVGVVQTGGADASTPGLKYWVFTR
jgi:hypothetical protein